MRSVLFGRNKDSRMVSSLYQWIGSSISFWFRNNFPSISLGVVAGPQSYLNVQSRFRININNNKTFNLEIRNHLLEVPNHVFIHGLGLVSIPIVCWGNKWNRVECTVYPLEEFIKQIGIHVLEQGNNMEDIQFTNTLSSPISGGSRVQIFVVFLYPN